MSVCETGNKWLFGGDVVGVESVTWWSTTDGETRDEGKALRVVHDIPHGSGSRQVYATIAVRPVVDALLDDPDAAAVVLAAVAERLGALLATPQFAGITS